MPNLKIMVMLIFLSYTHRFFMVPMSDGVRLTTDVYKRLHTILVRTPYGRTDVKGYALVIQSLRGFQVSEGEPSVFRIISQSWSSGLVCGAWFSAMGITQYL
jgi:predicted acyl esterase